MLLEEARSAGAVLKTGIKINKVERSFDGSFQVNCPQGSFASSSLVIAAGGLSLPDLGASPLGYRIAEEFGVPVTPLSPGLVPLTLSKKDKERFTPLAGIALETEVSAGDMSFRENLLFTHRGLSGPVILQISNYLQPGEELIINLLPGENLETILESSISVVPDSQVLNLLSRYLPRRLAVAILPGQLAGKNLKSLTSVDTRNISSIIHQWKIKPAGTEGYRTAEVTRGGISTAALSSKTFEVKKAPGLYFIGEVIDVTGWLGGYNLQWAWSSGWCAGQYA